MSDEIKDQAVAWLESALRIDLNAILKALKTLDFKIIDVCSLEREEIKIRLRHATLDQHSAKELLRRWGKGGSWIWNGNYFNFISGEENVIQVVLYSHRKEEFVLTELWWVTNPL